MSAWIVSKAHIDALVSAAVENRILDAANADTIGRMLWSECHKSVNYRYDEKTRTPKYTATLAAFFIEPHAALKLISCYRYQSCEHPGWDVSHAATWTSLLQITLEAREDVNMFPVPSRYDPSGVEPAYRTDPRYEDGPWGIDSLSELRTLTAAALL